jgi:hypothetical protein
MQKSNITIALLLLTANLGLAQTAMAQSGADPKAATKPDSGKSMGCPLGPMLYGYNKQCSVTGGS